MARHVELADSGVQVKLRRPLAVGALSIITLGIYSIVWYYSVNREMRDFGVSRGDPRLAASRPWNSVLAITIGSLVVIPRLVSFVRTVTRVQAVEQLATGAPRSGFGLTAGLIAATVLPLASSAHRVGGAVALVGFVAFVLAVSLMQARLNAVWQASEAIAERFGAVPAASAS